MWWLRRVSNGAGVISTWPRRLQRGGAATPPSTLGTAVQPASSGAAWAPPVEFRGGNRCTNPLLLLYCCGMPVRAAGALRCSTCSSRHAIATAAPAMPCRPPTHLPRLAVCPHRIELCTNMPSVVGTSRRGGLKRPPPAASLAPSIKPKRGTPHGALPRCEHLPPAFARATSRCWPPNPSFQRDPPICCSRRPVGRQQPCSDASRR